MNATSMIYEGPHMLDKAMADVNLKASGLALVPFMDRARFCALVGITPGVLRNWIKEGRVKTVDMGKRKLVDLREFWMK